MKVPIARERVAGVDETFDQAAYERVHGRATVYPTVSGFAVACLAVRSPKLSLFVAMLLSAACQNERHRDDAAQRVSATETFERGQRALAKSDVPAAIEAFKQALSENPKHLRASLKLAEAYELSGNVAAAILTLKSIDGSGDEPTVLKNLAELYLRADQPSLAVGCLIALRQRGLLSAGEVLTLAGLQGRLGHVEDARVSLEEAQRLAPRSLEAQVVGAELKRLSGDGLGAARDVDALLADNPELTSARVWRATYFLTSNHPEHALKDLQLIGEADSKLDEVVQLKAKTLGMVSKHDEAAALLEALLEQRPQDPPALALLAETRLAQGRTAEAQMLAERALKVSKASPRLLFIRGRALEAQGEYETAQSAYLTALKLEPNFAPALSRLWRLQLEAGARGEALSTLERLLALDGLARDEKLTLAQLLLKANELPKAKRLIDEGLKQEPAHRGYRQLAVELERRKPKAQGITIIRN